MNYIFQSWMEYIFMRMYFIRIHGCDGSTGAMQHAVFVLAGLSLSAYLPPALALVADIVTDDL